MWFSHLKKNIYIYICSSKWSESQGTPVLHEINPSNISGVPEKHLEIGLLSAAPLQYAIKPTDTSGEESLVTCKKKKRRLLPLGPNLIIYITTM